MRVLQIGKYFPPPHGGMETVLSSLVDVLAEEVQLDVLVANTSPRTEVLERNGCEVHQVARFGTLAGTPVCPSMPRRLRELFDRNAYDLLHLHFPNPAAHLAAARLPARVPLVISWHSDIVRQKRLFGLYRPFLDSVVRRADAIVAATPKHFSSSTQLAACPDPERRFVVPFGIDVARFSLTRQTRQRMESIRRGLPSNRLLFAVGRHVEYKGFEFLIRAMPGIPGARLALAGEGPLTRRLQRTAERLGVEDRVRFLGRVPDDELPAWYHAADVFCMPSVAPNEAFGLVQVEAMACGTPVVCCELGNGVTWVNQDGITGIVVPPRNPEALASAVSRLLVDDALREDLGRRARQRASTIFSLDQMGQGMLEVYRAVLGKRGRVPEVAPARRAA